MSSINAALAHAHEPIYLSPPHMGGLEMDYVREAFDTNWIAPVGPHIGAFEQEFARIVDAEYAVALSSGTAALHLALLHLGVGPGDKVLVSTLTFAASVNPIIYVGAEPIFIDSERTSWNINPVLLEQKIREMVADGQPPAAVIIVHLYGQAANMGPILAICQEHEIPVIEDAAEALGALYRGRSLGSLGRAGLFSFNGNKIITTSGGGMLVSDDQELIAHARKLSTQARDPVPHYEHSEIGYNYRMSNVLAAIGRGQLQVLSQYVQARRQNAHIYQELLGSIPGVEIMPEAEWSFHNRWLTVMTVDPAKCGTTCDHIRLALECEKIEARRVWKPMHMQPVFARYDCVGGHVSEDLFEKGLCLPSGSNLQFAQMERICHLIRTLCHV
ncbi:MAG: aminotransferase class I/II-fold pyridoxal phosphate-dependent enzyme [Caldilineaceae bacterium]